MKLVNRWGELKAAKAELNDQVAEIDDEIAELQQALIEYDDSEDVSVVVGDDFEATVKHNKKTMFPRKSVEPAEHTELERLLVESPYWDQVSSMDAYRLRALWEQADTLDPRLEKLLERFA